MVLMLLACVGPETADSEDSVDDTQDTAVVLGCEEHSFLVPASTFLRGTDQDENAAPEREVSVSAYCLHSLEVTNTDFVAFLSEQGNKDDQGNQFYDFDDSDDEVPQRIALDLTIQSGYWEHPVVEVSWWGAEAYCEWVGGRLPTEAEWEFAARGPDRWEFPWGDQGPSCDVGNIRPGPEGNPDFAPCVDDTTEVGAYDVPGPFGGFDLAGNAAEWVWDWYREEYYAQGDTVDPMGPDSGYAEFGEFSGPARLTRGGSFASGDISYRGWFRYVEPSNADSNGVGFRCRFDPL